MNSVPEKPKGWDETAFAAKPELMAMQLAKPCISKMPLPSAVKGNKSMSYRRDLIEARGPDLIQNNIVANMQLDLTKLALGECCTKSKYCRRSHTCKGINHSISY